MPTYTPETLTKAIKYAKDHPELSILKIAEKYGVNVTTLGRRVKGVQKSRKEAHKHEQLFSKGEEESIGEWCKQMDDMNFPITYSLLRQMAQSILKKRKSDHEVGQKWSERFLARNPTLNTRYGYYQEKSRQKAGADEATQRAFYRLLSNTVRKYNILPQNIWNCDEKGIIMGRMSGKKKVIVRAGNKHPTLASNESREFVTVLETINAVGEVLPPFIVWQGKTHREGYYGVGGCHDDDATFACSPSGYMDEDLGFSYMSEHFYTHTKPKRTKKSPPIHRLLIVDGHCSHTYWRVVEFALNHDIHMLCLPSHSTHFMQPLDVGCFGILSKAYSKHLNTWHFNHPMGDIKKPHFWEVLSAARDDTYTVSTIKAAWKNSGCWPINSNQVIRVSTPPPQQVSLNTPHQLKVLGDKLMKQLPPTIERNLVDEFLQLALKKVTQYRDIQPEATTLKVLRNNKEVAPLGLKHVGKGRILTRKDVQKGIKRLQQQKEEQELAAQIHSQKPKKSQSKKSKAKNPSSNTQTKQRKASTKLSSTTQPVVNVQFEPRDPTQQWEDIESQEYFDF